ncbi:MAG: 16S rRNA processing protein RimM [Bdellovibrionales bacterium]|nr:16S rRNA processing protein RimM [Bdellovibrionales bacterium]
MDWYPVGWVKSAHGIKGEIYVQLFSKKAEWLAELKTFQLKINDGSEQVFLIKRVKSHKEGLILLPEGFNNRNQSEQWKKAEFLIPKDILISDDASKPFLVEVEGFEVRDSTIGVIGPIIGFQDNGAHDLLIVEKNGNSYLIPFVDAFIQEINKEEKWILMNLPDGLFDEN